MPRFRSFTFSPIKGGKLMTATSLDQAGLANYSVKRNFRRVLDQEVRSEGHDYFRPNFTNTTDQDSLPDGETLSEPITLVHLARHPNGKTAVIVATPTTIWRYYSLETTDYYDSDYYAGTPQDHFASFGAWYQLATGFTAAARRWQAVNVNGYTVFNNGVDLPVSYRIGDEQFSDLSITPIYELRELGIASVGTMTEDNDLLVVGDIAFIDTNSSNFANWMNGSTPYGPYTDINTTTRITYRLHWSMPGKPERFAPVIPAAATASSTTLTLDFPATSLSVGDAVSIPLVGPSGATLNTSITTINPSTTNAREIVLADAPSVTLATAQLQRSDATGSVANYYDELQDDSSAITALSHLSGKLVIHKDTSIFLGTYTGTIPFPYRFEKIYTGSNTVHYRNTVSTIDGRYQIYAGRSSFFKLDTTNRIPRPVAALELCRNLFFDHARLADRDTIFSAINELTNEVFFFIPNSTDDKCLRYDYRHQTASTSDLSATAAATIKRPMLGGTSSPGNFGVEENWFTMGTSDGRVLRYGLLDTRTLRSEAITATQNGITLDASAPIFSSEHIGRTLVFNDGRTLDVVEVISSTRIQSSDSSTQTTGQTFSILPGLYARLGEPYDSVLASGLESYSDPYNEKDINGYVLLLANETSACEALVEVRTSRNPAETPVTIASEVFENAREHNLLPLFARAIYIGDQITINTPNAVAGIAGRSTAVAGVQSESIVRVETTQ